MSIAVVGCSQLVTLAGPARPRIGAEMRDLGIIADGAMLIEDGRIQQVGSRRDIEAQATRDYRRGPSSGDAGIRRRSHASGVRGQSRR